MFQGAKRGEVKVNEKTYAGCIVWCDQRGGSACGGLGRLMVSRRNENGKKLAKIQNNHSRQLQT